MDTKTVFSLLYFAFLAANRTVVSGAPSFSIDYKNNCFQKDGKPFQYVSGSIHYSRIPHYYWKDRLLKMYMAGLNAVQIYVPWNFHEEKRGVYNFTGDRDLENFLDLANQTGLLVILRPGPYICAEWEMGGLPAWLLQKPNIVLRSADTDYLEAVSSWMAVLLPKMRRWLYTNGGNIITVQVENEYGSYYTCDYNYMRHLRTLFQFFLGDKTVLFTTDGNTDREMTCGTLEGMYATIDFGTDVNISQAFSRQRRFEPRGPLVNSEFYTGWLDHWGDQHAQVDTQKVSRMLGEMLSMGASVNICVNPVGADHDNRFRSVVTSYDYNAPLSEAGDPTEKLLAIRDTISKYYGFMLYRTKLPRDLPEDTPLISPLNGVHDRAYVSVCGVFQGLLERDTTLVMNLTGKQGDQVDVLVENMGRVNFGSKINDFKGLLSNLILGKDVLTDWQIYRLDIDGAIASGWPQSGQRRSSPNPVRGPSDGPVFYQGTLPPNGLAWDTFLRLNEWTKGQVWINGVNLGRYWPKRGPQQTLYVPGPLLSPTQPNNITVLELERAPPHTRVLFMDRPQLNSTAGKTSQLQTTDRQT
uniref:Galactosidase, beta 1-like n=1 Tax=Oncorhynchus kisutch TaxID=8019 RepID=A0A8C7KB69_ONCKI